MDVKCVVCGEPWDYYGAQHCGDMEPWEWELFYAGAGCPHCEGKCDDDEARFNPESIDDFELGDEDPLIRIIAWEESKGKLKWKPTKK